MLGIIDQQDVELPDGPILRSTEMPMCKPDPIPVNLHSRKILFHAVAGHYGRSSGDG